MVITESKGPRDVIKSQVLGYMKQGAEQMQTKKVTVIVVHSTGKLRRATHIVLYVVSVRYGVTESILLFPHPEPPHNNSQRAHGMPKAKSRLLTYYAEPSGRSQCKFATLSNTSKRVHQEKAPALAKHSAR